MNLRTGFEKNVSLVGAGPGHEDLITIAGLRAIEAADVILYDALVNPKLLAYTKPGAEHIYVGKRNGKHSFTQNEINAVLLEKAFIKNNVVRLKGGDAFVFGRASEEIDYLESFGISVSVVPGISSCIAAPENQGIPLTKRGLSTSFWVMTATTKSGRFSADLILAAQSSTTMVILMGVSKIAEIVGTVGEYRSGLTPIALIQNGTLPSENCLTTTLNGAKVAFEDIDITQPGIIVIGDVVAEHPDFFEDQVQRVISSRL